MEQIPEDIAANLPPPRADEPASLRQDILDELRDHLQCAVRREQLLGAADHQTAWQCVLARFGNPTEIARKLYRQAMWSRIMQQRIVVASGVGMLAACLTMAGFMWVMLERQQLQADRQQANFEALLARMSTPSTSYGSLKIQVDRTANVTLTGGSLKDPIKGEPGFSYDATGPKEIDFGNLVPGIYTAKIEVPYGWTREHRIMLRTGETRIEEIQIPHAELSELTFTTDLPESYPRRITVEFPPEEITYRQRTWNRTQGLWPNGELLAQKESAVYTDLIGRVRTHLWYQVKPFSLSAIHATVESWPDNSPTDDAPDANQRFILFELKPGPNTCHVSVPADWIAKEQSDAERRLAIWKPRIREAVHKLLETASQTGFGGNGQRKRIAFLGVEGDIESLGDTIEDEIKGWKDFELVDRKIIEAAIAKPAFKFEHSDGRFFPAFKVAMTKLNQPFDYVLSTPLRESQELKLLRFRPDNQDYVDHKQKVASDVEN